LFGLTGFDPSNLNSLRAQRAFGFATRQRNQSLTQLSTGLRINRAADNPAGLIASEQLSQTLAALDAESSANQRASDIASTADGALGQVSDLLGQAKALTTANANTGGLSADERAANQMELDSIVSTVNRLSSSTTFNGQKLLDGNATISASGKSIKIDSAAASNLGKTDVSGTTYSLADLATGGSLSTAGGTSDTAGAVLDKAINDVATRRATIGSFDKYTLQTRTNSIAVSREQLTSAVSMIRDTDYTLAATQQSRAKLLQQSSLATLMQSLGGNRRRTSSFSIWA
jgi:flagellin-like hook-associated protein FlgL